MLFDLHGDVKRVGQASAQRYHYCHCCHCGPSILVAGFFCCNACQHDHCCNCCRPSQQPSHRWWGHSIFAAPPTLQPRPRSEPWGKRSAAASAHPPNWSMHGQSGHSPCLEAKKLAAVAATIKRSSPSLPLSGWLRSCISVYLLYMCVVCWMYGLRCRLPSIAVLSNSRHAKQGLMLYTCNLLHNLSDGLFT